MGFVAFVKKLFGSKTEVTETTALAEEVQPIILNDTFGAVDSQTTIQTEQPSVESQITDSVTVKKPKYKRRYYKPKNKVTKGVISNKKKPLSKNGKSK